MFEILKITWLTVGYFHLDLCNLDFTNGDKIDFILPRFECEQFLYSGSTSFGYEFSASFALVVQGQEKK